MRKAVSSGHFVDRVSIHLKLTGVGRAIVMLLDNCYRGWGFCVLVLGHWACLNILGGRIGPS